MAFSGGVNSSLALAVAARALPRERVLAVTSNNETYPPSELEEAKALVRSLGVEHLVVNTWELDDPNYASNPTGEPSFRETRIREAQVPRRTLLSYSLNSTEEYVTWLIYKRPNPCHTHR